MTTMINEMTKKFKRLMEGFFKSGQTDIDHAEEYLGREISGMVLELLSAYYEQEDAKLLADKAGRKSAGLRVERRDEKRQILTLLGELRYRRTYYERADGGHCHPIDELAGVEANQKVSGGVSLALVEAAITSSYAKSSKAVTGGQVSRQTVLHKIRSSSPTPLPCEKRSVPVLHIDADEDHVHLQSGKSAIVPLISVYEGIERKGKRGVCKNVVHYSEFGKKPEELWEEVLDDLERRYELEGTKIYLHGDGAAWIRQGLEWLPNSSFVLDRYHKNQALKHMVSGIDRASGCQYEYLSRKALEQGDREGFCKCRDTMLQRWPERAQSISESADYLQSNLDAISIAYKDAEAARGGATEPHVSHILSARLSSRPMGWSRATLEQLAPLLAAGTGRVALRQQHPAHQSAETVCTRALARKGKVIPFSLGLPHPDRVFTMPGKSGKVTPLYNALRPF